MVQDKRKDSAQTTKDKIIQTALTEFTQNGLEGARVDRIASEAGVNKAMIYYHYRSKDDLFEAAIEYHFQQVASEVSQVILPTNSLEEALTAMATVHVRIFHQHHKTHPLVLRELANRNEKLISRVAEAFGSSGIPAKVLGFLNEGIEAGRYIKTDPRQLIVAFLSMSLGYFFYSPVLNQVMQIDNPVRFAEERIPIIVRIFIEGIKAGEA